MTTQTLRPNGTITANTWAAHPSGTPAAAVSDASDSTYIIGTNTAAITFQFSEYALASNERCLRLRPRVRGQSPDNTTATQMAVGWVIGDGFHWLGGDSAIFAALAQHDGSLYAKAADGNEWNQGELNQLQGFIFSYGTSGLGTTPLIMDFWVDLDIRVKPVVASIIDNQALLGALGIHTHSPTLSWTTTMGDGQAQVAYQIRLYDLGATPTPNPDTTPPGWDSSSTTGSLTARRLPSLSNGSYRAFVRVAKDFNGAHWWSDWAQHDITMNTNPATPVVVTPAAASVLNTNTPLVGAKLSPPPTDDAAAAPNKSTTEWQIARDTGFTTAMQSITEIDANKAILWHSTTALTNSIVPLSSPLSVNVTWYVRARAKDFYGGVSAWSAAQAFTIVHPPAATTVSPTGGFVYAYDGVGGNVFSLNFYSTSPDEQMSAYQILIEDNVDGSAVLDTGKIILGALVPQGGFDASIIVPSAHKDGTLRWKVMVWVSDDTPAGSYSDYSIFQVSDAPTVTASVTPNPATSPTPVFGWTMTGSGGRFQAAYRVSVLDDQGNTVLDTGKVNDGAATSFTPADASILANNSAYTANFTIWDSFGLATETAVDFTTEWTEPPAPAFVVDTTSFDDFGYIDITWGVDAQDPAWVSWRVYRREVGVGNWVLLIEDDSDGTQHELRDFFVKANTDYEYVVAQVISEFGTTVESVYGAQLVNTGGTTYWLLCPEDVGLSCKLRNANEDQFTEEYETAELLIVGRGRKVDTGTRWGFRGSISAQLRDDEIRGISAHEQRLAIEQIKAFQTSLYLRGPFTDLWQVSVGDIDVTRVNGVGLHAAADIKVPYTEVS